MELHQLNKGVAKFQRDKRLNAWHIALLAAVYIMALQQCRSRQIKVSRSRLMVLSHINTLPTFHKYFKQLQDMDYLIYRPSYHPGVRSEIDIARE